MNKIFEVRSKDINFVIEAENRFQAFKIFFEKVRSNNLLDKIGHIAVTKDDGKKYPIRTVPALYLLGYIDKDTAIENLKLCVGVDDKEATKLLKDCCKQDSWVLL